jgi:precorrin-2 dehydrogenase / sirohydrochlorin ferrochelatase
MLPIIIDGARIEIALAGHGEELTNRLRWLEEGGALRLTVFTENPDALPPLGRYTALVPRLPRRDEIAAVRILWVAGLDEPTSLELARMARSVGTLVNVEDVLRLCDFHTPSVVRRGDLLLTVSTAGKSPGLAQRVRHWLERQFGPEWGTRLELLARQRSEWRRRPRSLRELAALTHAAIERQGWLRSPPDHEPGAATAERLQ